MGKRPPLRASAAKTDDASPSRKALGGLKAGGGLPRKGLASKATEAAKEEAHEAADIRPKTGGAGSISASPESAQPVSAQPVSAQPVSAQPVSAEPVSAQPISAEPVSAHPISAEHLDDDVPPALADALREDRVSTSREGPPSETAAEGASVGPPPSSTASLEVAAQRQVGSCELFLEIAKGGMATVHLGRWLGAGGFVKTVAVKALHPQFSGDPEFVRMFLDEARVVARIRHPNVMPIIDLVDDGGDLFIVMEYVHGVTLSQLLRQLQRSGKEMPVPIALRIMTGALHGLHAAHEAKDPTGKPMDLIHRDVTPENIMVGTDGYARLIDFGIASALGRATNTADGQVKGKPSYLAPEQIMSEPLDRRTDVYAASVVLWQALTGQKMIGGKDLGAITMKILSAEHEAPSAYRPAISEDVDAVTLKGMSREPDERYADAAEMAEAIEALGGMASHRQVGRFVEEVMAERLKKAQKVLSAVEEAPVTPPEDDELRAPLSVRRGQIPLEGLEGIAVPSSNEQEDSLFRLVEANKRKNNVMYAGLAVFGVAALVALWFILSAEKQPPIQISPAGPLPTPAPSEVPLPPLTVEIKPYPPPSAEPSAAPSAEASAAPSSAPEPPPPPELRAPAPSPPRPPPPRPHPNLPSGI